MLLRRICMADGLERLIRAVACALDRRFPRAGVSILEAREQTDQRVGGAVADALFERQTDQLVASALEDFRIGHDLAHQAVALARRLRVPAVHALARLAPLVPRRDAFGGEGLLCCLGLDDQAPQVFGRLARDEDVEDRARRAGGARGIDHLLLGGRPAILDPHRDAGAVGVRRRGVARD